MKAWLMAIIETVLRAIFRKSPEERAEAKQEKALTEWEDKLKGYERATQEAENVCEAYMATAHAGNGSSNEFARLRAIAGECAKAEAYHRATKPAR
jgi:hypothetical protein